MRLSLDIGLGSVATMNVGGVVREINLLDISQSNGSGRGTNSQLFTSTVLPAPILYGNDYVEKAVADPVDSNVGQVDAVSSDASAAGSIWPLALSRMLDYWDSVGTSIPIIRLIPCMKGGTTIADWQPGVDHENRATLYGSAIYRAKAAGAGNAGVRTIVTRIQGESDAADGTTESAYAAAQTTLTNAIYADIGAKTVAHTFPRQTAVPGDVNQDAVVAAIESGWGTGHILQGANLQTIKAGTDGLHLKTNMQLSSAADKVVLALQAAANKPVGLISSNQQSKSNQIDQWTATRVAVTANAIVSPVDGATTGDLVTASATSGTKVVVSPSSSYVSGTRYTVSIYAKMGTCRYLQMYGTGGIYGDAAYANFDLQDWVVTSSAGFDTLMEAVEGYAGWYRCQISFVALTSASGQIVCNLTNDPNGIRGDGATGANGLTLYLSGAQVEARMSAGPYVETT